MRAIWSVLLIGLLLGILVASGAGVWPVRAGLVGAAVMVATAVVVRRRWGVLADRAPGTPERALWISLFGNAMVASHLAATLWRIGPNMVMHTPAIHSLGVDSWTMVAGMGVAYLVARDQHPRVDERDQKISALGLKAAYYSLVAILILQIIVLGFGRDGWVAELSRPSIAHGLILAIIASVLADAIWRLRAYAADADAESGSALE